MSKSSSDFLSFSEREFLKAHRCNFMLEYFPPKKQYTEAEKKFAKDFFKIDIDA